MCKLATLVSSVKYVAPEVLDADHMIWSVIEDLHHLQLSAQELTELQLSRRSPA